MGERLPCKQEVRSSILLISTKRITKNAECTLKTEQYEIKSRVQIVKNRVTVKTEVQE